MRLSFKLTVMDFWHRSIQPGLETEIPSIHPSLRPTLLVLTAPQLGARRETSGVSVAMGRCSATLLLASIAALVSTAHPGTRAVASSVIRGGLDPAGDPAYFQGPADPEAESWIAQPGEFRVVLPRLASLPEPPWIEQISWEPRAFVYHNFLTPEECAHLVNLAKATAGGSKRATVADARAGGTFPSSQRTGSGAVLLRDHDPIVTRIEERISVFAMIPADHGEGMQILRYGRGEKHDPHHDYFDGGDKNLRFYGQRVATVLMYLSDVESGGETVFPKHGAWIEPDDTDVRGRSSSKDSSKCARGALHVKPRRGDALLFHNCHLNGREDPTSLHAGCPVLRGEKWTATKWMRAGPVEAERELRRRKEIKAHWEEKERRGEGLGEESKAKLNERGNLEG